MEIDLEKLKDSPTLKRLIEEVVEEKLKSNSYNRGSSAYTRSSGGYDRIHNRHNR